MYPITQNLDEDLPLIQLIVHFPWIYHITIFIHTHIYIVCLCESTLIWCNCEPPYLARSITNECWVQSSLRALYRSLVPHLSYAYIISNCIQSNSFHSTYMETTYVTIRIIQMIFNACFRYYWLSLSTSLPDHWEHYSTQSFQYINLKLQKSFCFLIFLKNMIYRKYYNTDFIFII